MSERTGVASSVTPRRALAAVLVLLGSFAMWGLLDVSQSGAVRVVHGWAQPSDGGAAIGLFDSPDDGEGDGFIIAGARWADAGGGWHDGATAPTCIGSDETTLTEVELGVVDVQNPQGLEWSQVVWLRCL